MSKLRFAAFTLLALVASVTAPSFDASAADVLIDAEWADSADAVVNATIVSTTTIQVGDLPHTVAELAVTETLSGTADETVYVVYAGGEINGQRVLVSHTPELHVGEEAQVALGPLDGGIADVVAQQVSGPLYAVAGDVQGVVALGDGGGAHGANDYVFMGHEWGSFSPPAAYKVNPAGSGVGSAATINAVNRAAQRWENDPLTNINFTNTGTTGKSGVDLWDGVNTISFVNQPSAGYLAIAHIGWSGGNQMVFDIVVNTKYRMGDGGGSGTWFDIETTVAHEIGHVLGLGHPGSSSEVMYASITNNQVKPLGAGDRNGMFQLYPGPAGPTCRGVPVTINMETGASGIGTAGNDVILGTASPDLIKGHGGNDIICGGGGGDIIKGGPGSDQIEGGLGADRISGGGGSDTIYGGSGNDTLEGGGGPDSIYGGDHDDRLEGQGAGDFLDGGNGNDLILGQNGADTMRGGWGVDTLKGMAGPDDLNGGDGADKLFGGGGNDQFRGGTGPDSCAGNTGNADRAVDGSCERKTGIELG